MVARAGADVEHAVVRARAPAARSSARPRAAGRSSARSRSPARGCRRRGRAARAGTKHSRGTAAIASSTRSSATYGRSSSISEATSCIGSPRGPPAPRDVPPARRAHARGLLHRPVLQPHRATCSSSRAIARACSCRSSRSRRRSSAASTRRSPSSSCAPGATLDGGWEDGWDELEVRALHEGDEIEPRETVHDDRGRLRAVRASGDGVPGVHGAAHAGHAQRQGGGRGGARQAHPLLPGPP